MEITRLFDILERDLKEFPKEDALCGKENGLWIKHSTKDYVDKVNSISYGLMQLGIKKGDCIATITPNRPEWNTRSHLPHHQRKRLPIHPQPCGCEAHFRFWLGIAAQDQHDHRRHSCTNRQGLHVPKPARIPPSERAD